MIDLLARKRVFIGTLYLIAIILFSSPSPRLWWIGFAVAFVGEAIRTWSSGYIFKNEELAQKGPYSMVRNPLYFGSFLLGFGLTLMAGNQWLVLIYPALFLPIYLAKIRMEERDLHQFFGEQAAAYFDRVPRFFPNLTTYTAPGETWNLQRVVFVHKEWTNWFLLAIFSSYYYYVLHMAGG